MKKNVASKVIAGALAATMVLGMAACGDDSSNSSNPSNTTSPSQSTAGGNEQSSQTAPEEQIPETLSITFGIPSDEQHTDTAGAGGQAYQNLVNAINEYTGMTIDWKFRASADYYGQLGTRYTASDVEDVMVVGKDASFIKAANEGLFWDLTPYLGPDSPYENLATIPERVLEISGVNGKYYGIPRLRSNAARSGFGYRLDWLQNLGLDEPKTWDDFKDMLYQFTYNDPDQDGIDNTVGLGLDQWDDVWLIVLPWFGVPDTWGLDANGDLIHYTRTEQYKTAMKEFRELYYEKGVINNGSNGVPDFLDETLAPGKARDNLLRKGLAGAGVQVLDDLRKVQTYFEGADQYDYTPEEHDDLMFALGNWLDTSEYGGDGQPHAKSNNGGYNNLIAISKKNIKTEAELKRVLQFLNDLNDGECLNLIEYGWEGLTYDLNEDGYVVKRGAEDDPEKGVIAKDPSIETMKYSDGFNQCLAYATAEENARPVTTAPATSVIQVLENSLYASGAEVLTPNYGSAFTAPMEESDTDTINQVKADINQMQRDYIRGEIDDAGFEARMETIWNEGLKQWTEEMNQMYHESN